ncbi:MAG: hypothetical protein ACI8UO_003189 [Verrucomicrobiales bacterium]|jgi:hypothetical protein
MRTNRIKFGRLLFAGIVISLLSSCGEKPAAAHRFEFGLIDAEKQIHPTTGNKIPHQAGLAYGWRLTFPDLTGSIKIREVLTLPDGAEWKLNNRYESSEEPGPSLTERLEIEEDGKVFENTIEIKAHESVARFARLGVLESDPVGAYRLEIFVEGKLIETCEFQLVKPDSLVDRDQSAP